MEPLTVEEYRQLRAEGFTDEDLRDEGFEIPSAPGGRPTSPLTQPPAAADLSRALTVRRPETEPDPYGPARTAVHGLTFGTSPTIRGAVHAVGSILPGGRSPGQAYQEEKDAEIAGLQNYRQREPGRAAAIGLTAGLPLAFAGGAAAAPRLARPLTTGKATIRSLGTATGIGAGIGAVSRGGSTPGDVPAQLRGAAEGAVPGAAIGLGSAAALNLLSGLGRYGAESVRGLVGKPSTKALERRTDETITAWLARTGQTPADVLARRQALQTAGVTDLTTAEALGPAGIGAAKQVGAMEPALAGRAFQKGQELGGRAGERVTSPRITQLYAEAKAVGPVDLSPQGLEALNKLQQKFPKMLKELDTFVTQEKIPFERLVDETGNFTVEYYDLVKKYVDAQVYGKALSQRAKDASWLKMNRHSVEQARHDLVAAVDDAVQAKVGTPDYASARRAAEQDIQAQQALGETRQSLGKELQRAAGKTQAEGLTEEAGAAATGMAQRPKIAASQALMEPLRRGVRTTARKEAGSLMEALLSEQPDELLRAIARRQVERQLAAGRGTGLRSVTLPALLSRRTP